eukprot:TRINITY_DN4469_c0_g1_i1.p1 TRINITY_DN4469_c0_g1~~TRINITY_DN4469_c0_g1_i1.p1  ORF type:complete len:284 (+),score=48.25 TRINITY_DN4469_c0_g1_i1:69-920(+)
MTDYNHQFLQLLKDAPRNSVESYPADGKAAWERLQAANNMFINENTRGLYLANLANEITADVMTHFNSGQKPYATILTCSDSRVSPEIIFGEGLGLLFVVRVAGNVIEPTTLGTIEYGVHHLGTPLLVIMGHEKCGAVIAAAGATDYEGGVGKLLYELKPSIDHSCQTLGAEWWKSKDTNPELYQKALREAIQINAVVQEQELLETSEVIRHAVDTGKLKIVLAYYNITTGRVEEVEERLRVAGKTQHAHHSNQKKEKKKEKKQKKEKEGKEGKHKEDKHKKK